jgi:hypothetical protein
MTLSHPDPLDRIVDRLIWRMEERGFVEVTPFGRDALHALLREELLAVKSDPWDDWA